MIKAVRYGKLNLGGDHPLDCYVLDDGSRVVVAQQIQGLLGSAKDGMLSRSLSRLSNDSEHLTVQPRKFLTLNGGPQASGYTSEDVTKILRAYSRAYRDGKLHEKQVHIALAAMAALEAFADIGLRSMIDLATDTPMNKEEVERKYLDLVIAKDPSKWVHTFDREWDETWCRLYGHPYEGKPPRFVAFFNDTAYTLSFGGMAKDELKRINPNPRRGSNHHQHLTPEAKHALSITIATMKGLARISRTPTEFFQKLSIVYKNAPLQLDLGAWSYDTKTRKAG